MGNWKKRKKYKQDFFVALESAELIRDEAEKLIKEGQSLTEEQRRDYEVALIFLKKFPKWDKRKKEGKG